MIMTKTGKQFLSLVSMICLIVICLPSGIFALESDQIDFISFSENVTYNGSPQVLAEINEPIDGKALDPLLIEITYEEITDNGKASAEITEPPIEPGTYLVTVKYEGDENYQSYIESKEIIIKPIELKPTDFITKGPATKVYDGTTNVADGVIEGLSNSGVLEKDLSDVNFSYSSSEFTSKDVNPIELNKIILNDVTISGDKGAFYHLIPNPDLPNIDPILVIPDKDSVTVELSGKITPKPVGMLLIGEDKVYDADARLDGYDLNYNAEDVIKGEEIGVRTTDAFNPWYGEMTAQIKDVGEYYVWASEGFYVYGLGETNINNYTVEKDPIRSIEKYTITPIPVIVEAWFQSKIEGDPDPELTYVIWLDYGSDQQYNEGLLGEDIFSGSLNRTQGESPGKYDISIGTLNNPNYTISFENGENMFEIRPMPEISSTSSTSGLSTSSTSGSSTSTDIQEDPIENNSLISKLFLSGMAIVGGAFFMKMRNI